MKPIVICLSNTVNIRDVCKPHTCEEEIYMNHRASLLAKYKYKVYSILVIASYCDLLLLVIIRNERT